MHYFSRTLSQVDPSVVPRARYPSKASFSVSASTMGTTTLKGAINEE